MRHTEEELEVVLLKIQVDALTRKLDHAMQGLMVAVTILSDIRRDGIRGAHRFPRRYGRIKRAVNEAFKQVQFDIPY